MRNLLREARYNVLHVVYETSSMLLWQALLAICAGDGVPGEQKQTELLRHGGCRCSCIVGQVASSTE